MSDTSEHHGSCLVIDAGMSVAAEIPVLGPVVSHAVVAETPGMTQARRAIRRNFPVIGRCRHSSGNIAESLRRDIHAMDRDDRMRRIVAHRPVERFELEMGQGGTWPGTRGSAEIAAFRGIAVAWRAAHSERA